MAESQGEWTGSSCLSSNAEMERSKQEEVTRKNMESICPSRKARVSEGYQEKTRNASTGKQGQKDV